MQRGFTLVELAVVLTIIGLIIGGVIVGADMIKSAGLNSLWTDKQKYVTAVNAFRDKYQYLPGDMPNATQFWGVLAGTGSDATCQNTPATGTATCNGNGNGQVSTAVVGMDETLRFWQHLANAGLIDGQYIGTRGTNAGYSTIFVSGVNRPASKMSNILEGVSYIGYVVGDATNFTGNYGHVFQISSLTGGGFSSTPADIYQFDNKFDDGLPGSGMVISTKGDGVTNFCTTAAGIAPPADAGAKYNLSDLNVDCQLKMLRVF